MALTQCNDFATIAWIYLLIPGGRRLTTVTLHRLGHGTLVLVTARPPPPPLRRQHRAATASTDRISLQIAPPRTGQTGTAAPCRRGGTRLRGLFGARPPRERHPPPPARAAVLPPPRPTGGATLTGCAAWQLAPTRPMTHRRARTSHVGAPHPPPPRHGLGARPRDGGRRATICPRAWSAAARRLARDVRRWSCCPAAAGRPL